MTQKLVIVESPTKAKTIKKFLGRNFKVEASMGHIRDLPKSQLGVDIDNNFEPKYITIRGKGEILVKLRKAAKNADEIYLATDPDREGEAIAWHLTHVLKINGDSPCRIEFNEITKQAVTNAIKNPRLLNQNLIDAQQARRVLDRVVGYKISPLLWRKVRKGLSAGRVQSVATRIICDRENEIQAFRPEEYWTLKGVFYPDTDKKYHEFEAYLYGWKNERITPNNKEEIDQILSRLDKVTFKVERIQKGQRKRKAPAPFTTSTLQQDAARKLGFSTKKTMMLAQQLYEGVDVKGEGSLALITYIRTDSTRVSVEAQNSAKKIIESKFGREYYPSIPNVYKSKKGAQDAHEAIRPTYINKTPDELKDSLKRDQLRLYRLIYDRFLASQMTPALYEVITIHINADEYSFRTNGSRKIFPGYTAVYKEENDEDNTDEDVNLPPLKEGQLITLKEWKPEQHFTQPPPRYTEASLVRALEDMGIGRPSTYAPTISTILSRGYVERDAKTLIPTELGQIVNDLMMEYFPSIMDYKFTAEMEQKLDEVEDGNVAWRSILQEFYKIFSQYMENAERSIEKIELEDEVSDVICEKCGSNMVIKIGRYGKFLACPNFPDCRNTKPILEEVDAVCPKCNGAIVVRKSKKGRKFYGCENYPECNFVSWDLPVKEKCPNCGSYMIEKITSNGKKIVCSDKQCGYIYDSRRKTSKG
ncbi:MAG: type I DNA topoisomerase [Caldicoprobacterales bacterium]|jgi:DNA topoisomerase-1|nr:type I DNA topoisomerase [Clostridiales bacterium]